MKSWYTLVHREFLEHRIAFVYVPAVLVTEVKGVGGGHALVAVSAQAIIPVERAHNR